MRQQTLDSVILYEAMRDAEVAELLLQDSDINVCLHPSLFWVALCQENYRLLHLLVKYNVPANARTMHSIASYSQEAKSHFAKHYKLPDPYPLLLQGKLENLYEDYQKLLGYYMIIKDIDFATAKKISKYVLRSLDKFWQNNQNDCFALLKLMSSFYPSSFPELHFACEMLRLHNSKEIFFDENVMTNMQKIMGDWFSDCFLLAKQLFALPLGEPSLTSNKPISDILPTFSEYGIFPNSKRAISALKFLSEEKGLGLETAKQMIADTKRPKNLSSLPNVEFWQPQRDATVVKIDPSWLDDTLNFDDKRIKPIENSEFHYLLLTNELDLSGPFTTSLLEKSRWVFAPTNAIKKIQGEYPVELIINQQSLQITFTHEICATNTSDRILCSAIADARTGHELLIPCYYCSGGLHHNNVDLPKKIELHLNPMRGNLQTLEQREEKACSNNAPMLN